MAFKLLAVMLVAAAAAGVHARDRIMSPVPHSARFHSGERVRSAESGLPVLGGLVAHYQAGVNWDSDEGTWLDMSSPDRKAEVTGSSAPEVREQDGVVFFHFSSRDEMETNNQLQRGSDGYSCVATMRYARHVTH